MICKAWKCLSDKPLFIHKVISVFSHITPRKGKLKRQMQRKFHPNTYPYNNDIILYLSSMIRPLSISLNLSLSRSHSNPSLKKWNLKKKNAKIHVNTCPYNNDLILYLSSTIRALSISLDLSPSLSHIPIPLFLPPQPPPPTLGKIYIKLWFASRYLSDNPRIIYLSLTCGTTTLKNAWYKKCGA